MGKLQDIEFSGYQPGGLAALCALQSAYYARDWGFTHLYESVVSASMAEFLERFDPTRDFVQLVQVNGVIKGGIVIDSHDGDLAQLHWFILSEDLRGSGAGRKLMSNAMKFVTEKNYPRVYLTTFDGLQAARHLYEEHGFVLTDEQESDTWGTPVLEQHFDWTR